MKKSLVSILIAAVLFFSNIGMTTFAVDSGLGNVPSYSSLDSSSDGASAEISESNSESYEEDEISYYKISDFTALPENISHQKVRVGAGLDAIEFPDILEVKVEPDLDREDRIMRKLAQERERIRREQEEADAASSASSDEAASEGSSFDEDGEEIIFFGDEEITDEAGELSEEEDIPEEVEPYEEEKTSEEPSQGSTINPAQPEEPVVDEDNGEEVTEPEEPEIGGEDGDDDTEINNDSYDNGTGDDADRDASGDGLVGRILSSFRSIVAYAAENEEKEIEDSEGAEDSQESEVSIERISGIEWVLEAEYNDGLDFFSPDYEGQIYLFTPVLVIPDNYYIEDELPIITVTVTDEYFPFDEKAEVDGVTIRVRADKGVFPEGATVSARKLDEEAEVKVQEAFDEQVEVDAESIVKQYTFDISILDRDGKEIEPDTDKGRVFVSFETEEVSNESLSAEVYHILDSAEAQEEIEENQEEEGIVFFDESGVMVASVADDASAEVSEDVDDVFEDNEAVLGAERESLYSDESELVVEKLESFVVDVEEGKAVEAETFSFSTYKLVFMVSGALTKSVNEPIINLEELLDNEQTIPNADISAIISFDGAEYAYVEKLKCKNGTREAYVTDDGLLSPYDAINNNSGTFEYFLVVKKPFKGTTITLSVDYGGKKDLKLDDKSETSGTISNYLYPTAKELATNEFRLEVDSSGIQGGPCYQWQKQTSGGTWVDIEYANKESFHYKKGESETTFVYEGCWIQCLVNGNPSKAIQIVTPNGDSRVWNVPDSLGNQCYVSNGKIAYTFKKNSDTQRIFDVIGEFQDGNTKKMASTTVGGEGWKIFSDLSSTTLSNVVWSGDSYNMDLMYFSFSGDNKLHVTAQPKLASSYTNFAVGARCQMGSASSDFGVATLNTDKRMAKMAVIDGTKENAQKEANNGTDGLCSVVITPTSGVSRCFLGTSTAIKPYHESSSSATEYTDGSIGVALGWSDLTGKVEFDIAVGGVTSTKALEPVSKTGDSKAYTLNNNVKNLKLSSDDPLVSYAKSDAAGGVNDTVKIELRFASGTSNGKTAISNVLPTYTKAASSSSTTTTSSSNTNSSSGTTTYSADYFDVNVKNYKNGNTSGTTVNEINNNVVIVINYNFDSKEDIKVYRDHDGASELKQEDSGAEGTCKIDKDNGKIYIYTRKFSTYAVAYRPITYYTVTFNDGTNTNTVKVKAGEKVEKPADPVKEGYVFKGWFVNGNTSSEYNFDSAVTTNLTLKAGWVTNKEAEEEADAKGGSRAPGTNDTLPIVWLWVLVFIGGIGAFGYSFYERYKVKGGNGGKPMNKLQKTCLLIGIVVSTVVKFLIKKIKQHKYECMLAASAVLIMISAVTLISTFVEYRKAEEIYIDVNDEYVDEIAESTEDMANSTETTQRNSAEDNEDWWKDVSVDVAGLSEEYPDVVGWIYFENEDISYPIMYSGDNSKYLSTAYTGESARAGAIFIDGESTPDFSDPHSLIYGHNMRDLTMFGRLRYYKTDASYYDEHQYFQVFTKDGIYRYHIFAYEEVPDNHDVFWVYGENPDGMDTMLKEIEKASYRQTGVEATDSDHVITLATCTSKEDKRLIISAVRTDEHLLAAR